MASTDANDGPAGRSDGSNTAALVALVATGAATAAVSFTTVNRLKDAAVEAALRDQAIGPGRLLAALGPADGLLMTLAAGAVLVLLCLEWRCRALSRLFATAGPGECFVLLTMFAAWFGHSYFNPGVLLGGDTGTHVGRFFEVQRGLEAGRLAVWTNYQ